MTGFGGTCLIVSGGAELKSCDGCIRMSICIYPFSVYSGRCSEPTASPSSYLDRFPRRKTHLSPAQNICASHHQHRPYTNQIQRKLSSPLTRQPLSTKPSPVRRPAPRCRRKGSWHRPICMANAAPASQSLTTTTGAMSIIPLPNLVILTSISQRRGTGSLVSRPCQGEAVLDMQPCGSRRLVVRSLGPDLWNVS